MRFDIVVFTQEDLAAAIDRGIQYIALCDNQFVLPCKPNIHYIALGTVLVAADFSKAAAAEQNIIFTGFTPKFRRNSPKSVNRKEQTTAFTMIAKTDSFSSGSSGTGVGGYGIELI